MNSAALPQLKAATESSSAIEAITRFDRSEEATRAGNYRLAALLALGFMLVGSLLDRVVMRSQWETFLVVRIVTAAALGLVLLLLRHYQKGWPLRLLGHLVATLPMVAILWMISYTGRGDSPYYAGLNLVLVGASLLVRWPTIDSILNALLCLVGYLFVVLPGNGIIVFNNAYFIFVTAVFACVGNAVYNMLRLKEFTLRESLEVSRKEIAESHAALQALDEAKTRFFANISHELRTPLTLILGPIDRLRHSPTISRDSTLSELVATLEDNGFRLLRLINELLDLVRLDGGQLPMRITRVALEPMFRGIVENLRPLADSKQIEVRFHWEPGPQAEINIDRDRLEKILFNLGINAIKFTPNGGRLIVAASVTQDELKFSVKDTGPGIKADDVPQVFHRFWQADTSRRRRHGGVGIGLSLAKDLVDSLGGQIWLESQEGVGSTFLVSVPIVAADQQDAIPAEVPSTLDPMEHLHQRARTSGITDLDDQVVSSGIVQIDHTPSAQKLILVADDEPALRRYLLSLLHEYRVIEARDGREAWEMAKQYSPDLIILDLMMPEVDGIEVTRRLRKHQPTAQTPIMLVTANAENTPRIEALEAGANEFLTKPFASAELQARLGNLFKQREYADALLGANKALEAANAAIKENEAELVHSERLAGLGRMSAGIIHEINNPLNYARTALHTLKMFEKYLPDDEKADYADTCHDLNDGIDRVIRIISDLRAFTKGSPTAKGEVNLANVVEASRRLVSNKLTNIQVNVEIDNTTSVWGNESQLVQVFVNLLSNSSDFVLAAKQRGEEPRIDISAEASPGGSVEVTFRDNGCGIPPADVEKVFDPFFTKREVGEGTGLGLSIVHQICTAHGGQITVSSELNRFTEFRMCFPSQPAKGGSDD